MNNLHLIERILLEEIMVSDYDHYFCMKLASYAGIECKYYPYTNACEKCINNTLDFFYGKEE